MTFLELAERVLEDEKRPMTANEIWQNAILKRYDKELNSEGKTPWATLGALIYVNAKDNPKTSFAQTGVRPKKFYLKTQAALIDLDHEAIVVPVDIKSRAGLGYLEKDLHKYLTFYAYYYLGCQTKTINHSLSTKKEFGEWVHPDIVGCYFPIEDWKDEVFELSSTIGNISIKLLSFELKRKLSFANLRESFFQTVSNSSWANESYLVTAELSNEKDFLDELQRLSISFGIGVIKLNMEDPHSSEISYPARTRDSLDWETINKLTMNSDFREFLARVKIDYSSKKIHKKEYDQVIELNGLK
jgi:hypothetical protein